MRRIWIVWCVICCTMQVKAQFTFGTTGLMNMPTADMQRDKTFMFGGAFLEKHATPTRWTYNTWDYYMDITIFPWLEVSYICTLHKAIPDDPAYGTGFWVPSTYGKFVNQDRQFAARVRLWKEGWWQPWTPQIVIGGNDVIHNSWELGSKIKPTNQTSNGFYNRYYIAATKHFYFKEIGELGAHVAWIYNIRKDYPFNGPAAGVNFQFELPDNGSLLRKAVNGLNLMAEYDNKSFNAGFSYGLWKDYINLMCEMNRCRYFSGGVQFKIHLK